MFVEERSAGIVATGIVTGQDERSFTVALNAVHVEAAVIPSSELRRRSQRSAPHAVLKSRKPGDDVVWPRRLVRLSSPEKMRVWAERSAKLANFATTIDPDEKARFALCIPSVPPTGLRHAMPAPRSHYVVT